MTTVTTNLSTSQNTRTYRDHIQKISKLKDEVKELHPILKRLFPCLPTINKVEYRQGPSEMGADFVLERKDPALEQTNYVGVIAKIGSIKQDHSEVNRQIEECQVERYFDGGQKKITISEIWIVATGTITENAKAKIHNKYSARAIKFVSRDELAERLETHVPEIWDNLPPGISAYFAELREALQVADNQSNIAELPQSRFYIELDIHKIEPQSYSSKVQKQSGKKKKRNVDIQKAIEARPSVIVIEGEMGYGKSKLIRELAYRYIDPVVYQDNNLIPVVANAVTLVKDYDGDISALVDKKLNRSWSSIRRARHMV